MLDAFVKEVMIFITSEQIWIALLGVTAIAFSQSNNPKLNKWASVLGLAGQPFWFYMAYKQNAWGVGFLCVLYTWAWGKGFYKHWILGNPWFHYFIGCDIGLHSNIKLKWGFYPLKNMRTSGIKIECGAACKYCGKIDGHPNSIEIPDDIETIQAT